MQNKNGIDISLDDLVSVMAHRGAVLIRVAHSRGGVDTISNAQKEIAGARGALIHFTTHPDYPIVLIHRVIDEITESISDDADVILGIALDDTLEHDEVFVTSIITGLEQK
ncbi:hypothetical protein FACS189487_01290 [Campylobacterota bacterium]|nr:hypothetical protein FACS189487_01290 [Campylobacterota bacterium]